MLMVSPVAAAACEVVCGVAPHAAHRADEAIPAVTADEHAHHGTHAAPSTNETVVLSALADAVTSMSIPAPECDLLGASPARVRSTVTEKIPYAVILTSAVLPMVDAVDSHQPGLGAASRPPAPPPHTPLPLRI
jgi:hypothetical protein